MKTLFFLTGLLLASTSVAAATPAVRFTGGSISVFQEGVVEFPLTVGWSFSTSQAFSVTSLGFWDQNGDGLLASHRVGIWDAATATLLVDTTVGAGTGSPLIDGFRYQSISPFNLSAGSYVIGALIPLDLVNNDNWIFGNTTVTSIAGLSYGGGLRGIDQAGFVMPSVSPSGGRFGPNMLLSAGGVVPEPTSWAMLIAGFGLVGAAARRRRIFTAA